jgi:hypothetical protein
LCQKPEAKYAAVYAPIAKERHVAEVEQAGESDDDVQPERHDHVHGGHDHVVEHVSAGAEPERGERGEPDQSHGCDRSEPHVLAGRCALAARVTGHG